MQGRAWLENVRNKWVVWWWAFCNFSTVSHGEEVSPTRRNPKRQLWTSVGALYVFPHKRVYTQENTVPRLSAFLLSGPSYSTQSHSRLPPRVILRRRSFRRRSCLTPAEPDSPFTVNQLYGMVDLKDGGIRTFFCSSDPFKIFLDKSGERFELWGLPAR